MLKSWNEVDKALEHAQKRNYFVLPIVLVSKDEPMESAQDVMVNILRDHLNDATSVLTFKPSSKTEMQSIIDALDTGQSKSIPVVFSKNDVMFRGFLVRKMKNWMHTHFTQVLKST